MKAWWPKQVGLNFLHELAIQIEAFYDSRRVSWIFCFLVVFFFYFTFNLKGQQNLVDTRWPMRTPPSPLLCSQSASLRWRPCVYLTQRPVINRVIMHKVTHLQRSTWGMDHWQNKPITLSLSHQPAVHFLPKFLGTLLKRPSGRFSHTLWDFWGTEKY